MESHLKYKRVNVKPIEKYLPLQLAMYGRAKYPRLNKAFDEHYKNITPHLELDWEAMHGNVKFGGLRHGELFCLGGLTGPAVFDIDRLRHPNLYNEMEKPIHLIDPWVFSNMTEMMKRKNGTEITFDSLSAIADKIQEGLYKHNLRFPPQ